VGSELTAAVRALAMGSRMLERSLEDMTLPQFRVLGHIAASPERASRIAERAAVSRPSLTGLLDGLEAKGWVTRADVAGDRRGVTLAVTPAGRTALAQAEKAMTARLSAVLGGEDRTVALQGLAALGRAIEARMAEASVSR
jgi:DNA-binding MarR family transcriptional regulator